MNATHEYAADSTSPTSTSTDSGHAGSQPLRRPVEGRMLGGVAAGIARSLGVDPVLVRVAFAVLMLVGAAGLPLYLAGWLLIPDEASGESVAAQLIESVSAGR